MYVLFHGPSVPGPNIYQGANHEENRSRFRSRGGNRHADVGGRVLHRAGHRHKKPTVTTQTVVGDGKVFTTREEATTGMKTVKVCQSM